MSNGSEECCALGICCPSASAERVTAIAQILTDNVTDPLTAQSAAACLVEHFDLAPVGTLVPLLRQIATLAKKHG
jgi:hypothetical protein